MTWRVLLGVLLWTSIGMALRQPAQPGSTLESRWASTDPELSADPDSDGATVVSAPPVTGGGRTFLAWQPTGVWNPHHPEKFGILHLTRSERFR